MPDYPPDFDSWSDEARYVFDERLGIGEENETPYPLAREVAEREARGIMPECS